MNEQAQGHFVHPVALGEGERIANRAPETLTQDVIPTLDVAVSPAPLPVQRWVRRGKTSLYASQKSLRVARQRYAGGIGDVNEDFHPPNCHHNPLSRRALNKLLLIRFKGQIGDETGRTLAVYPWPWSRWHFCALTAYRSAR